MGSIVYVSKTNSWINHLKDKYQAIHKLFVHNIGNLSLSADNSQVSNKSFEDKKQILKEQSKLKLNRFFINSNFWEEKEIKQRADELFNDAKELWNYEDVSIDILLNSEEKEYYTLRF